MRAPEIYFIYIAKKKKHAMQRKQKQMKRQMKNIMKIKIKYRNCTCN